MRPSEIMSPGRSRHNWTVSPLTLVSVGAFEIGKDQFSFVFLDLQVEAANPVVVELDRISFLPAYGQWRRHVFEDVPPVGSVQDP